MAIAGIGTSSLDLAALARANSLQYTGLDAALRGGLSDPGGNSGGDSLDGLGLSADTLGISGMGFGKTGAGKSLSSASKGTSSFEDALFKAMDGVNADQQKTSNLLQKMVVSPDSVNAHDVTIAMAEATLSLNLARTILDRIVRAWKEVINTR
jgi:flagellar hook-basal body complex protein FliE